MGRAPFLIFMDRDQGADVSLSGRSAVAATMK
jgi:hypothetical protein